MREKSLIKSIPVKQDLVTLGLTQLESDIYLYLLNNPYSTYSDLSNELSTKKPSLHRCVSRLRDYGLVRTYPGKPVELEAIDPSVGLESWVKKRHESEEYKVSHILRSLRCSSEESNGLRVEIVDGKNETFLRSLELVKELKKDMIILSIGEPIPEELFHAIVKKIREGVNVRMIAEEYHDENKGLLSNWRKNGYKVRHLPDPKLDFTLVIYDDAVAMLHIRMEPDREKRTGIFFFNPGYVKAQRMYLEDLWTKAVELDDVV